VCCQTDRDHGEHCLHDGDDVMPVVIGKVVVVESERHDPAAQRLHSHIISHYCTTTPM